VNSEAGYWIGRAHNSYFLPSCIARQRLMRKCIQTRLPTPPPQGFLHSQIKRRALRRVSDSSLAPGAGGAGGTGADRTVAGLARWPILRDPPFAAPDRKNSPWPTCCLTPTCGWTPPVTPQEDHHHLTAKHKRAKLDRIMQTLNADQVARLVKSMPEKTAFDWKTDFTLLQDDEKKGEFLKDLSAIANACVDSCGFIIYGVDPRKPDPILGITVHYDDANLQQFARGKIEPLPEFLYYEVPVNSKTLGVLQINPTRHRPHIISVNLGKVRRGQILIRRGSSTDGVAIKDLIEFFYGPTSTYFPQVIKKMQANAQQLRASVEYMRELRAQGNDALRDAEIVVGAPKGSLGAIW
jgi:hypothetical protein